MMNLTHLLRQTWSAETSIDTDWTPINPALGQCAVTALVVQDYLGGEIIRGVYQNGEDCFSHYWNRLPSGVEIDLTAEQFDKTLPEFTDISIRDREHLLSYQPTAERYELLRKSILSQALAEGEESGVGDLDVDETKVKLKELPWTLESQVLHNKLDTIPDQFIELITLKEVLRAIIDRGIK